ncbi:MAG: hypothetical protein NZ870_02050 [bacterium]|nr:hypothetical protein [bacterium]
METIKKILKLIGVVAAIYLIVGFDVYMRAKEAYNQGMKYLNWHENPELKKEYYIKEYDKKLEKLKKKKLSDEEFKAELELLEFEKNEKIKESSIKYAYQWFKDCYELFSPPESIYVKKARLLAPECKMKWREELEAKKIPYEEYNLDLEPGETDGFYTVFATKSKKVRSIIEDKLRENNFEYKIVIPERGINKGEIRFLVERKNFWAVNKMIKELLKFDKK